MKSGNIKITITTSDQEYHTDKHALTTEAKAGAGSELTGGEKRFADTSVMSIARDRAVEVLGNRIRAASLPVKGLAGLFN